MKFTDSYYDSITQSVTEAEEKTAAEIVVVIHPRSGNYRDVDYLFGAFIAWLSLLFILFSERAFHPYGIPVELLVLFTLSAWVCSATPLRRWLTSQKRRERQVKAAAAEAFSEEGVTHTRARTGVLIYLSVLERQIEVIGDLGVVAAVPSEEWNAFLFELRRAAKSADPASVLLEYINKIGSLLARYLPATEDNPDEIPNRPRVAR